MSEYDRFEEIHKELVELSSKFQKDSSGSDRYYNEVKSDIETLKRLYGEIGELQRTHTTYITALDKDTSIQEEKNSNIFYQLEQLERRLEELERSSEKDSDNTRQFVEKIVMLIIGGLVTWLFNVLQK